MSVRDRGIAGPRNVLVLGGSGFIGTNLARALSARGHFVISTARQWSAQSDGGISGGSGSGQLQQIALSLTDVESINDIVGQHDIDTVVHLASSMKPASSFADYLVEREEVFMPTMKLAHSLAKRDVRLIYFSSGGTIYGRNLQARGPAREDDAPAPISYYGQAKMEIEAFLQFLNRTSSLRYLIVRPSNPYGPHQSLHGTQGLVSVVLGRIAEGWPLEVWGDGSAVRDYIYIDDLVDAVRALIERGVQDTILNIGSGVGHSLLEVVQIAERVTAREIPLVFKDARPTDVPHLVLDISRMRDLGLDEARPFEIGMRDYVSALGLFDD